MPKANQIHKPQLSNTHAPQANDSNAEQALSQQYYRLKRALKKAGLLASHDLYFSASPSDVSSCDINTEIQQVAQAGPQHTAVSLVSPERALTSAELLQTSIWLVLPKNNKPEKVEYIFANAQAGKSPDTAGIKAVYAGFKDFKDPKDSKSFKTVDSNRSNEGPILEAMIDFPPSDKSRYCRKDKSDTICDKVDWSVRAGNGIFVVKLYFGDPTVNSKIDLQLTGLSMFSGVVPKNQEVKNEKDKDEVEGEFTGIFLACEEGCNYELEQIRDLFVPALQGMT